MTSTISRSISSPLSRRNNNNNNYYQPATIDSLNLSDSFPLFVYTNPLVTIIYSTTKGRYYTHTFFFVSLRALNPLTVKKKTRVTLKYRDCLKAYERERKREWKNEENDCKQRNNLKSSFDMETSRRNSTLSSIASLNKTAEIKKQTLAGTCTFIKLTYGGNQFVLLSN